MIAVTGKTGRRWSTERKTRARSRAERLGDVERVAVGLAERAATGAVRAAESPVGVWVAAGLLVAAGSLQDVRL